jgi:hypothetical protein
MGNCNDTTTGKPVEVSNVIKADVNFTVIKGDTFDAVVSFKDSEGKPLNFTGATLHMAIVNSSFASVGPILEAGSGFTVTGSTVSFNYIPTMQPDTYFYDLQCTFASGLKKTLMGGKFKVLREITIV